MKKKIEPITCDHVILRLITKEDILEYYKQGFEKPSKEINRLTGTTIVATLSTITEYVNRIVDDENRYDFLILNQDNLIIGEAVLNEIDWNLCVCNFRICLFKEEYCGKGMGNKIIKEIIHFGFAELGLSRIELDVIDFNTRAYKAYLRAGFHEIERLKDEHEDANGLHDVIVMAINK